MTDNTDPLAGSLSGAIERGPITDLPAPGDSEPMTSTSIRLPVELLQWAKAEAGRRQMSSWSALVRELLEGARHPVDGDAVVSVAQLQQAISQMAHRSSAA